jgi:FkbM family methyltransferase
MVQLVPQLVTDSLLAGKLYGWVCPAGREQALAGRVLDRVLHPNSNCLDVGSRRGDTLRQFFRRAPAGRHFGIEPLPERFAALKARFPQATLFNVAASDRKGDATLRRKRGLPVLGRLVSCRWRLHAPVEETHVLTARLDDLIPRELPLRLVKIDAVESELRVLRGAEQLICRSRPYILLARGSDKCQGSAGEVFDLLLHCGLVISLLEDWLIGNSPLGRQAFRQQHAGGDNHFFLAHP